jgi:hypothetical protein
MQQESIQKTYPADHLFRIPIENKPSLLSVEDGILEVLHPNRFKKGMLIAGDAIMIPVRKNFPFDSITFLPVTNIRLCLDDGNREFPHAMSLKNLFTPVSRLPFSSEFLNTFYSILKIMAWHLNDSPRQPLSLNMIKMECSRLEIKSDLIIHLVIRILRKQKYLKALSETSFVIKEEIQLDDLLWYVKSMINSGITDPWYFYEIQKHILKYLSNLQIIAISNEFTLEEEELIELFSILDIEWYEIEQVLKEWHQQKYVKIFISDESRSYTFLFSNLQNLFSLLYSREEIVRELIRIYYVLQNEIYSVRPHEQGDSGTGI